MNNLELETLLKQNNVPYTFMEDGYWQLVCGDKVILLFHDEESEFLRFVMPLVSVPATGQLALFRHLLEVNCTGVFCGSFAIHPDSDSIIYIDQIPTHNLGFSELMTTLNSFVHMMENHLDTIEKFAMESDMPEE